MNFIRRAGTLIQASKPVIVGEVKNYVYRTPDNAYGGPKNGIFGFLSRIWTNFREFGRDFTYPGRSESIFVWNLELVASLPNC